MAFGFGFNKAKVLASAEKNVKQGKLHNAIADYEKIVKEEPRDLNVLNTTGDLYARVGNIEQATACFKKVGDAYASDGFTVKAIAMYKKLTKQNPTATDALIKLAELYTQQGLYNDARMQYTQVMDQFLRGNDLDAASVIVQKMLELDPDNPQMQARLADLYVRLGKKPEARDIYFRSAQALRSRGALEGCDAALGHVLQLDPGFAQAVLLRGQVKLEANDAEGAVHCLETLPDIDSRPEALRVLLRARLKLEHHAEAEPLARKLLAVYNDPSGMSQYAAALLKAGDFDAALRLYREHADRLLAANAPELVDTLHALIARVKSDPRALECLCELFTKAGNTTHLAEVTELLAHAYVQEGTLVKARDLYQRLADMEPENPLHVQNYKQIVARLGQDSAVRMSAEEGSQALMAEELEQPSPAIEQKYSAEVAEAISAALTDAELFASYNLPARAIPPLEGVLPRAPRDVQVNQQLAALYARVGRCADAAGCCAVLQAVLSEAGQHEQAREYAELAAKYRERAGVPPQVSATATESAPVAPPAEVAATAPSPVIELQAAAPAASASATAPVIAATTEAAVEPAADATAHEIDLSEEWDRILAAEPNAPVATPVVDEAHVTAYEATPEPAAATAGADAALGDLLEEVQFYVAQAMWDEARAAFARAEAMAPQALAVEELRAQLASAPMAANEIAAVEALEPELPPEESSDEIEAPEGEAPLPEFGVESSPDAPVLEPEPPVAAEPPLAFTAGALPPSPRRAAVDFELDPEGLSPETSELPVATVSALPPAPVELSSAVADETPAPDTLLETDALQASMVDLLPEPDAAACGEESEVLAMDAPDGDPASAEAAEHDVLGAFALDLENSLGPEFAETPAAPAEPVVDESDAPAPHMAQEEAVQTVLAPPVSEAAAGQKPAAGDLSLDLPAEEESAGHDSSLSDLFAEFKHDLEAGVTENEDPETHYNLGVAFKEMGLLDEAIAELQKVCQAVEQGSNFPQVIEAFTWLADCFVQKGLPEAGIRWYEKALAVPDVGDERALAIHYELACAQQAAGDRQAARQHFLRVLSVNIDYRDVGERIKALKS